ncbi:unnamed protein product [Mytilus edulis]|uniref:Uncharacterized protein n=1 Tax=Mytilus edulis TaxID=6550 RepID=A0A8S3RA18_MYTED|nr:unnamed protein product [Mytilus edulis]
MDVNLAPHGVPLQRSNYPNYPANLAIEGPANNKFSDGCSVTAAGQTYSWWGLQLPAVAFMTNILIYYREHFAYRMDEFSLYLENGTADQSSNSGLCYSDKGIPGYPDITQKHNLVLKGTWGTNCATICPDGCIDRHCFPQNGSCVWGCDIQRCVHGECDPKTAVCTKGCVPGLGGRYCTFCRQEFPCRYSQSFCSNTTDSWADGTVLYNAEYHYNDTDVFAVCKYIIYIPPIVYGNSKIGICEIEIDGCPYGKYGDSCHLTCSENCMGPCDLITGNCLFGCTSGWLGAKCERECSKGKFGLNCTETCDGCIVNECNHINGVCKIDSVCKPGYVYGKYCNENDGCKRGWKGDSCDQECVYGYFGFNCAYRCETCFNQSCDIFEGNCRVGCNDGYRGRKCETQVSAGSLSLIKSSFFMGGFASMLGILLIILTVVVARRRMLKKQESRKGLDNSHSNSNEQHYDDIMKMESVSTYQDLAKQTINLSSDYDQINNAYTNQ